MIITHGIKMDLENQANKPCIRAAQGDTYTRIINLSLYAGDTEWNVPEGAAVAVAYSGSSGKGIYDTLPDGSAACTVDGNVVTAVLVPQVLRMQGHTDVAVVFSDADGKQLATFCVEVNVEPNPAVGAVAPEEYVNMQHWLVGEARKMVNQLVEAGELDGPKGDSGVGIVSVEQMAASDEDDGDNVVAVTLTSGEKAYFTIKNGSRGPAGAAQTPLFANSLEECSDAAKLYVLPDGYVYAYMPAPEGGYTNVLKQAVSEFGGTEIYNGIGYMPNTRMGSSATISSATGMCLSGIISAADENGEVMAIDGAVIRIKNVTVEGSQTAYLISYSRDGIPSAQAITLMGDPDDSGVYAFAVPSKGWYGIRLSVGVIDETSIVTINEEIKGNPKTDTQTGCAWQNTGHAFIPADYEDRIVALEEISEDHEDRIAAVEGWAAGSVGVPSYVQEEAERVADLVLDKRTAQSIVFAAASDFHYPYDDATDGNATTEQAITHTGMGIAELRKYVPMDFVGFLGDYVKGASSSTIAESKAALKFVRKSMYEAGLGVQQIWLQGNHDRNPYETDDGDLTDEELYSYIFAANAGTAVDHDNVYRGYGYKDFEAQKIRVIYWNSSDCAGAENVSDFMFSAQQLRWMADVAFDFSGKDAPADWGIVILSHMPLNWLNTPLNLVDGYISGTRGTVVSTEGESVAFDFTGAERAEVICCINGHTHNFRAAQIGANGIWQIAVPQVCAGRYNEYGTSWPEVGGELDKNGEPVYYYKTADSAQSTSFCVFVIDRKLRKIHVFHYGAGIDRNISY